MKNKNGFTLVELLAVIAILAVLVIVAIPNVIETLNSSKKSLFFNDVQTIYKQAQEGTIFSDEKEYSNADDEYKKLNVEVADGVEYYAKVDNRGNVLELQVTSGNFQYEKSNIKNINDIKIDDVKEKETLNIKVEIKKDGFEEKVEKVYNGALMKSNETGQLEFSNKLSLPSIVDMPSDIDYYVKVNETKDKITYIEVINDDYQYEKSNVEDVSQISKSDIKIIDNITPEEKIIIEMKTYHKVYVYDSNASDKKLVETLEVEDGKSASVIEIVKPGSDKYEYVFSTWLDLNGKYVNINSIKNDISIYPVYNKLKVFYINGEKCTFIDKVGGSEDSSWGRYRDFCSYPDGYGGSSVGSCPSMKMNSYLTNGKAYMYFEDSSNAWSDVSKRIRDLNYNYLIALDPIIAGGQYGDINYIEEYAESHCFVKGTQVYTENGYKNIEDININDKVWSFNEKTNEIELSNVTNTINFIEKDIYELKIENETIYVTGTHPFYVKDKGWTTVNKIKENDYIKKIDNTYSKVLSNRISNSLVNQKVYNITVDNNHTYFVTKNRYLVHNKPS